LIDEISGQMRILIVFARQVSILLTILLTFSLGLSLFSCTSSNGSEGDEGTIEDVVAVQIAAMKGPTSMGLSVFMSEEQSEDTFGTSESSLYSFQFSILEPPETIFPLLIGGDLDIALVPANASAILYERSDGGIQVISINALGSLYVVSGDTSINSFDDLRGRTVIMAGRGATPEYVINMLLAQNDMSDVRLEYKSEIVEVAATIASDPNAIAILPEPFVTTVMAKNPALSVRLSLADVWSETVSDESSFVLGVTVVRTDFAQEHPEAVREFLLRQASSVESVNSDPAAASQIVAELGFIDNAGIAEQAIPNSNLVCITGSEMRLALTGYFAVLFAQDPDSVGGALPGDDFFFAEN